MYRLKLHTFSLCFALVFFSGGPAPGSDPKTQAGFISRENIVWRSTGALTESALRNSLPDSCKRSSVLALIDSLQSCLHAGLGYHSARIGRHQWVSGRDGESRERLAVWIERGEPTRFGRVVYTGLGPADQAGLRRRVSAAAGSVASDRAVEKILRQIVEFYADRGHPYCAARIVEAEMADGPRIELTVQVERGRPVSLGEIRLSGATQTKPAVLRKLSGLAEGRPYSETEIRAARRRLLRSGLFRSAAEPLVLRTINPHRVALRLQVEENPANRIEGALGSGGGAGRGALAGFVRIGLGNLFGTARSCRIEWERPRADWSGLRLEYHEPWLLGKNLSLDLGYGQQVRDSTFSTSRGRVRLSKDFSERLNLGLGAIYENTSPGSETYIRAESSRYWSVSGSLDWSNILRPLNPQSGLELKLSAAAGRRRLEGRDVRELRLRLYSACYRPLVRLPHQAALGVGYAQVAVGGSTVAEIPYHARLPIGGATAGGVQPMVRGHVEEAWRGKRVAWANLEYRYLVGENSRVYAFYDIGAAEVPRTPTPAAAGTGQSAPGWRTQSLQGFGAGLQLESRLGIMGIAVAFSPERGLGNGRIHLRLTERF